MRGSIFRRLALACALVAIPAYYRAIAQPTLPFLSFTLALLWIPTFALLALIAPSCAQLERLPDGSWRPRGLDTAHATVLIALVWAMSRDMDITTDVGRALAQDFEMFHDFEVRQDFSLRQAVWTSMLSVAALEVGKWLSLKTVPLFEGCKMLKWDAGIVEETEAAELKFDKWAARRSEWEEGFW